MGLQQLQQEVQRWRMTDPGTLANLLKKFSSPWGKSVGGSICAPLVVVL
jgi:hypothetical protein